MTKLFLNYTICYPHCLFKFIFSVNFLLCAYKSACTVIGYELYFSDIRVQNNEANEFICNGTSAEISWEQVHGSGDLPYQITVENSGSLK